MKHPTVIDKKITRYWNQLKSQAFLQYSFLPKYRQNFGNRILLYIAVISAWYANMSYKIRSNYENWFLTHQGWSQVGSSYLKSINRLCLTLNTFICQRKSNIMLKKKTKSKKCANVGRGNVQKVGGKIYQNQNNSAESRHQRTCTES